MDTRIENVGIIMDGNGRWANRRFHPRVWGHIRGASVVSNIVEKATDLNLKSLTLYAFSTENWKRPQGEVSLLFKLLKKFLIKERSKILKNNIKFDVIGDISSLPLDTQKLIEDLTGETKNFLGLKLSFAFGYGSRQEIVKAVNSFIEEFPNKKITEEDISNRLETKGMCDLDLLIRTGGDLRVSNFLLWQIAYSELFFSSTLWPDFSAIEFENILKEVSIRERRFGGLTSSHPDKSASHVL